MVEQLRRAVPGGIGTYARGLVQGLAALGPGGPEVRLLASRSPRRGDDLEALGPEVVTSRLPSRLLTRAWDAGLRAPPAGVDVIHATSLVVPGRSGAPMVAHVHDLAWRRFPEAYPRRGRRWHEAALHRVLARAGRFIVPSAQTGRALVEAGADPGTVSVVEEGCDHLAPADPQATASLLAALGVGGPYLLSVGTLEPRKNLAGLAQAYRLARPRLVEPWPLLVVGPGGWGPPASAPRPGRRLGRRAGRGLDRQAGPSLGGEGVVMAGAVAPGVLSGLMAGARCLAYVPLLEGWGLPAVEAMSLATPVVASPMPSTAGQALEVDPMDPESIAEGLVQACQDGAPRSALVAAGLARAAQLTWEATARAHLAVWEELV